MLLGKLAEPIRTGSTGSNPLFQVTDRYEVSSYHPAEGATVGDTTFDVKVTDVVGVGAAVGSARSSVDVGSGDAEVAEVSRSRNDNAPSAFAKAATAKADTVVAASHRDRLALMKLTTCSSPDS
ncbi:hypothetical protein [Nocardia sp. NPDC055049]